MAAGLDAAQGLSHRPPGRPLRAARLRLSGLFWRHPWAKALAAARAAAARLRARLPRGARRAVRLVVLDGQPVHDRDRAHLEPRQLPHALGLERVPDDRAADDRDRGGGDAHRRAARVPARATSWRASPAARSRAFLFVAVLLPLWSSYLIRVYIWRLILNQDGVLNWTLRKLGLPAANIALHELGGLDRLHVRLAAVHDPAGLRRARAHPRVVHRGVARPRRAAASRRSVASSCRSRCPASSPARSSPSRSRSATTSRRCSSAAPRSQFIGNVVYDSVGVSNNVPFAAAFATVPLARDGRLPPDRAPARRVRGACDGDAAATRIGARASGRRSSCSSSGCRSR